MERIVANLHCLSMPNTALNYQVSKEKFFARSRENNSVRKQDSVFGRTFRWRNSGNVLNLSPGFVERANESEGDSSLEQRVNPPSYGRDV